jgi:hypothetical protein
VVTITLEKIRVKVNPSGKVLSNILSQHQRFHHLSSQPIRNIKASSGFKISKSVQTIFVMGFVMGKKIKYFNLTH